MYSIKEITQELLKNSELHVDWNEQIVQSVILVLNERCEIILDTHYEFWKLVTTSKRKMDILLAGNRND